MSFFIREAVFSWHDGLCPSGYPVCCGEVSPWMQDGYRETNNMAQDVKTSGNAVRNMGGLHKDSGFAVVSSRWYIAECKSTKERTIRTALRKAGYETYVASQVETRVYKSRNRRLVEKIVIPCKVFVRTEESELMNIMREHSSVYRFMLNRAASNKPYAFVPDSQMQQLRYVLDNAGNPVLLTAEDLKLDQKVRVMRGPLAGFEAWFYKKGRVSYIVVRVEMGTRHYAYTEIPIEDVQPIQSTGIPKDTL